MDSFFKRALPYIEMGWPVFPTRPDKVPLCPHGRKDATCVASQIEDWSEKFPDANVSIKTGEESGICVIDIDSEEGEQWLSQVNASWSRFPDTAEAKSGRGRHFYFSYLPVKSAAGQLAPGVDIRARGGSITAPVSLHASGKLYEWVKPPFGRYLPLLPLWIVKALAPPPVPKMNVYDGKPPTDEHLNRLLGQIVAAPMGQRNHTLNRIAFIFGLHVKDQHMQWDNAYRLLMEAARTSGLPQIESDATIRSGLRSGTATLSRRRF